MPYAGICGTGFADPLELARYRYRIPIRSVCAGAAEHLRVAQIVDGHNWLPNAIEDVRFAATAVRSKRQPRSLADFRGKIVLLNVWATWCAPCIKEIPALDHLAAALNGADFAVVAVSVDRKGIDAVRKVFTERDVQKLPIYIDRSSEALRTVRAIGLPTSLLIDREGREFGRAVGPAQWDDDATIAFFRYVVSHESPTNSRSDRIYVDPNR